MLMDVYKNSFVDKDELDFENYIPYFKDPLVRKKLK